MDKSNSPVDVGRGSRIRGPCNRRAVGRVGVRVGSRLHRSRTAGSSRVVNRRNRSSAILGLGPVAPNCASAEGTSSTSRLQIIVGLIVSTGPPLASLAQRSRTGASHQVVRCSVGAIVVIRGLPQSGRRTRQIDEQYLAEGTGCWPPAQGTSGIQGTSGRTGPPPSNGSPMPATRQVLRSNEPAAHSTVSRAHRRCSGCRR